MTSPNDTQLLKLEEALEAERAWRCTQPDDLPDAALEPSYARSDEIEAKIAATVDPSPAAMAVKLRQLKHDLAAEGCVSRWVESLERDLEAASA